MRTTLTIDDDLAGIPKHQAREMGKPLKEIVNTALRRGLVDKLVENAQPISVRPHDFGASRPRLDLGRLGGRIHQKPSALKGSAAPPGQHAIEP